MIRRLLLACFVLCSFGLPLHAAAPKGALVFAKTEISETPKPEQTEMIGRFTFENRGAKTVRILEVETDCSCCTTASLEGKTFAPGEKGEVAITFKFGTFTGLQRKGAVVKTDDPAQPHIPLSVIATLPEILNLPKNVLLWQENERPEPKSLTVYSHQAFPVKELRAATDSRFLKVAVERVAPTEFRVQVTPDAKQRDITATVQLEALLEDTQRKMLNAFVRVR